MQLKEIQIEDMAFFEKHFAHKAYRISETSFMNLYAWSDYYRIYYTEIAGKLCLFFEDPFEKGQRRLSLLFPMGEGSLLEALSEIMDFFQELGQPFMMKGLTQEMIDEIEAVMPDKFLYTPTPDSSDYVYLVEDLVTLKGKKYHAKRNFINTFKRTYHYAYHELTAEWKAPCIDMLEKWLSAKKESGVLDDEEVALLDFETEAAKKLLNQMESGKLKGGVITVDDRVAAFTIGEQIAEDTCLIHIEKGDTEIRGIYPMINQAFLEHTFSHLRYVNREEDAGIPGLRRAKESYYPVMMLDRFCATLKEETNCPSK